MSQPLSPTAQAVLQAITQRLYGLDPGDLPNLSSELTTAAAVAIHAAADQVVPEGANAVGDKHDDARHDQWMRIRYKLLAIAAELKAQP